MSRVVARLKTKTKALLFAQGLRWQGNFFEHQMRDQDSTEDVLFYLLLNPSRAGLVKAHQTYSWFWLHPDEASWFRLRLNDDRPEPEWLR